MSSLTPEQQSRDIPASFQKRPVRLSSKADRIHFKPNGSVLPKYVNFGLNSAPVHKGIQGMVHGVGQTRLNPGEIKSISLPLPPLAEQKWIVAEVERRLSVVDEWEAVVSANLHRAIGLRQSILQKTFKGDLIEEPKQL